MMRMHAGGTPQDTRMPGGKRSSLKRTRQIRAGDNLAAHAGANCAPDDRVPICRKTVMREVRPNINQVQAQVSKPRCDIFDCHCKREF